MDGKIIKGIGGFYYVKAADGVVYECKARGIFRKDNIKPAIGDEVEISVSGTKGSIDKILERRSHLIRPPVANIDVLVIVAATADPAPDIFLIDKLLVTAQKCGITPVICINKTDIKSGEEIRAVYEKAGYSVVCVCAKEQDGFSGLIPHIKDKTSAFAGLSGVGKSTILNVLTKSSQETGEVSDKIKRGRHTTRHVELLDAVCGGYVLDTPGFSSFEVESIKAQDLWEYFPEMHRVSGECRFKGCSHINEPDCAVKKLVETGEIAKSRYKSYCELYNQLKNIKEWEK